MSLSEWGLFQSEVHHPFKWEGGPAAALLIHGFPGTPAELRPIGNVLHQQGWTVQGLLLPGFGPDIGTLFDRDHTEWLTAVRTALLELKRDYDPVLVIGYSMGAALAMQVAAKHRPTGLVLLAPFRQYGNWYQNLFGQLLKPFFREIQPFQKADFSDPETRAGLLNFFPDLDLADLAIQQSVRELRVPTRIFGHLNRAGSQGARLAHQVDTPTLLIQGRQDEVVQLSDTRKLIQRLPGQLRYLEVESGHDLVDVNAPTWNTIHQAIVDFSEYIVPQTSATDLMSTEPATAR